MNIYRALSIIIFVLLFSCEEEENSIPDEIKIYGTMLDQDGNKYKTIKIGNQIWMAQNLRTTTYRNGDKINRPIDQLKNIGAYERPKISYYNENINNDSIYGYIYNGWAIKDERNLAPEGWRIPTPEDWNELITFLGGDAVAGGKLKSIQYWSTPNVGATNESGFNATPAGIFVWEHIYSRNGDKCSFYGSYPDENKVLNLTLRASSNESSQYILVSELYDGASVRLIKE